MTACLCSNGQISVSSTKRREGENKKVMRKRRGRSEISEETLNSEEKGSDFFACYLLASLSPRHKGHSYIGFTVNPRRRIRQHNGEITSGAWKTKSKRPWEMVVCIYGFPTNVSALQFEWAWQHPTESLAVRAAAAGFKSLSGIANKIKLVYTMLTLPAWKSLNLSVNFFSTKYTKHSAGCPRLPEHMRVHVSPMDELPCYSGGDQSFFDNAWDDDEELGEKGSSSDGLDQVTAHEETTVEQFGGVEEHGLRQPGDSACPEFQYSEEGQENTMRQPANLPTSKAEYRLKFSVIDFSVRTSPFSAEVTLDDKDTSGLNEENTLLTEGSPATVASDRGEPKISSLDTSCETEVIDLLICSPELRIDPYFKKRTSPFSADVTLDDKDTSGSDEENILLTEQSPATVAAGRVEPKISSLDTPSEIEVVDLLSCSPGYRIDPCFKKRRATTVHPEIIDLTNSPIFVDL